MNKDEAIRIALGALKSKDGWGSSVRDAKEKAIAACEAALEANDKPVGLIESLKDAQPCCGQYETCWRACTPRGKFIGHRDAQRKPLTETEILLAWEPHMKDGLIEFARAIEAAHGIKEGA